MTNTHKEKDYALAASDWFHSFSVLMGEAMTAERKGEEQRARMARMKAENALECAAGNASRIAR